MPIHLSRSAILRVSRALMFTTLKRLCILASFLMCFCVRISQVQAVPPPYTWHTVGSDHFSQGESVHETPIVIASDGTIYVAYTDETNDQKANVMKYDGSDWSFVGSANFTSGGARSLSLALDATDTPYLAFVDLAGGSRAHVVRFTGHTWVTVGDRRFSNAGIQEIRMVFDPAGTPYVIFIDTNHGSVPTVMKLRDATWEVVGTPYSAPGSLPTLAFTSEGVPYASFSDTNTGEPTVISFDGSTWNHVGDPIPVNVYGNTPLAIDSEGNLYVAVADVGETEDIKMFKFDGVSWSQLGSDFAAASAWNYEIAVDSDDTPYVSFLDLESRKGTVITYNGSAWVELGNSLFTTHVQGPTLRLAIGPNDGPYVVASDYDDSDYRLTVHAYLPTAPGQVTGFSNGTPELEAVELSWNAVTDTGGSVVTGYRIQRESPVGGGYQTIATSGAASTTYRDAALQGSTTYRYRVQAINAFGEGKASQTRTITTPLPPGGVPFIAVMPSAHLGSSSSSLGFSLDGGARTTTSPLLRLDLNVDPHTVRGYAASLDPEFKQASIFSLDERRFSLPNSPGEYTVYLKYFSTTGHPSETLSQTIAYLAPATSSSPALFSRVLKRGSTGDDVRELQRFFNRHGFSLDTDPLKARVYETGYFGPITAIALSRFQEAYADRILLPSGLRRGTGVFGAATRKLVEEIMRAE